MQLILASNNKNKIRELQLAFPSETIESYTTYSEPIDVVENGKTYVENALIKAKEIARIIQKPVIGDDGGLELCAFPDKLGIHTSRFFEKGLTDRQMNEQLLNLLEHESDRRFKLHASLVLYNLEDKPVIVEKVLTGRVSETICEGGGYGFDSILIPTGYAQTLSLLSMEQRDELSPRNQAFNELIRRR
ncbi:non-canonical purine NTP pyrophosphatase [Vagococcus teuberi]